METVAITCPYCAGEARVTIKVVETFGTEYVIMDSSECAENCAETRDEWNEDQLVELAREVSQLKTAEEIEDERCAARDHMRDAHVDHMIDVMRGN